jgi:hypothetical protein
MRLTRSHTICATICIVAAGLLMPVTPLLAHHSFAAEYDSTKPVTLQGKFIKMDWVNPHSWIHLEVANAATGKVETWDVETGPPNTLYRNGWRKDAIKAGEEIVVTGTMAKNGSNTVNARSVKTPDGRTLLAGSSEGNSAGAPPPQTKQ